MTLPQLTESERGVIARTWAFRAESERRAERRFARLTRELIHTGAAEPVIELTRSAVEQERRHTVICDRLATEFGWQGSPSEVVPEPEALGPTELCQKDRLLFEMMAFCCFTETLNSALLVHVLRRVQAPQIRAAVHEIVQDEVSHSRAGWAHLHACCGQGQGAFLSDLLPLMMELSQVQAIFGRDPSRDGPRMAAYGELDDASRIQIFRGVMRDVFYPGLEGLGIQTHSARTWLAAVDPGEDAHTLS